MKRIIMVAITLLAISGCCKNTAFENRKIADKIITQSKEATYVYYHLLLENGELKHVDSYTYVSSKIGDYYSEQVCKD